MAITIEASPSDYGLTKNELLYKLLSNNTLEDSGAKTIQALTITGIPSSGDTFDMEWLSGGINLTFTFDASPNDSGLELPTGSGSLFDYINDDLIPALKANYFLNRDFDIFQLVSGTIRFQAREYGDEYDITYTSASYSWNPSFVITTPGASRIEHPNFKFLLELYFRKIGASDWNMVSMYRSAIDQRAYFDLSNVLRSFDRSIVFPDPDETDIQDSSALLIEYYVRFAESYGETENVRVMTQENEKVALPGGLNTRDFQESGPSYDLSKFLTFRRGVKIRKDQPLFLSWLNESSDASWEFVVDYLSFGQSVHTDTIHTFICNQGEVKTIPCSYNIAMDGQAISETVTGFRFWVLKSGDQEPTSEIISVIVDDAPSVDEIYLAYRNSLGFIDTLPLTGVIQQVSEIISQEALVHHEYGTNYGNSHSPIYNIENIRSFNLHTGHLNTLEAELLNDLLMSDQVSLIVNNKYWPCTIAPSSYAVRDSHSGARNNFTLEVKLLNENNFSDVGDRVG